jgi:Cu/Zn superoxide dismutase
MTRKSKHSDVENRRRDVLRSIDSDCSGGDAGRRSFLRGAAASVAAAVGLTGTATALDTTGRMELRLLRRRYEPNVGGVARSHGGDLLDLLAEAGYLSDGSMDAFDEHGVAAWRVGDTATARIEGRLERADGKFSVSIEPETGRAYAVHETGGDWTVLKVGDDGELTSKVTTSDGWACLPESGTDYCDSCAEYPYTCDDGMCELGYVGDCCMECRMSCGCSGTAQ